MTSPTATAPGSTMPDVPRRTTGPSREEKKAQTRAKLLDAAAVVFARKGFNGASLDDVAEEAGLTKGAVYSNFAGKSDLIQALIERVNAPMENIANIVYTSQPHDAQAAEAGEMLMSIFEQERDTYLLLLEHMTYLARNPDAPRASNYPERVSAMAEFMQAQADAEGLTLPMPAKEFAVALYAIGQGLLLERLVNPEHVPDDLFGKVIGLIYAGVEAQSPGKRGNPKR